MPATVVMFELIPARVDMLADCDATVPVSATLPPTTASPVVSWKAKYLPRREALGGNVILAVPSVKGSVNALLFSVSIC